MKHSRDFTTVIRGARVGLLLLVGACGPSSDSTTGASTTDASTADAATADASTADASTAVTPTEGGSTQAGSTEGGEACEPPPGPPVGPPVSITITNMGAEPVFLDRTFGCVPVQGFQIVPAGAVAPLPIDPDCQFSCDAVIEGVECACALGCPIDSVLRFDPGVSTMVFWSGGQIVPVMLAQGCGGDSCAGHCVIEGPVPAGDYTLVVPAASTVSDCQEPCECPPDEVPCVLSANRGPADRTVELAWNYPAMTELAVVFE